MPQSFDPIAIIKTLLDSSNNQQESSLKAQDTQQATQNAYQKGVNKALSEHGYKHGSEALMSGVDPNEIANHDAMQPTPAPAQNNVDPTQLLTGIVAAHILSNNSSNSIEQQASNIVKPATSIFGKLMENLGNTGIINAQKLANLAAAQKISSGQPAEIALPASEAAIKTADLAAGAPAANVAFTKQQVAQSIADIGLRQQEIQSGIYKAQSERDIQNIQRLTDRRKQVLDQMNEDLQHGPILNRGKRLDNYRKQLDYYDMQLQQAGGNITKPSSSSAYVKTGTLPDGRRVGVKSDGTTEIINGK